MLAVTCFGLVLRQRLSSVPPPAVVVDLVASPWTRIDALGDRPLARFDPLGPPSGALPEGDPRGHALRLQVEAHTLAVAVQPGPDRVRRAMAYREALSAELSETAAWPGLVDALWGPG